ncbi:MAG: diacylglycerol kinase family protein [Planctomycetota bacterium]|jgi:diacylglycerol kinase|nr:MAG: diacylglycerol kinase family protein [Planctomycetota bacterium]
MPVQLEEGRSLREGRLTVSTPGWTPPKRSWLQKFGDAFRGLYHAVSTEWSFAAHLPVAAAAVALAAWLGISPVEWCLVALSIGGVIAAEVFNTSVESLARALDSGPDQRVKDALDTASAAVLVAVGAAIMVGLVIFGPRLLALLR